MKTDFMKLFRLKQKNKSTFYNLVTNLSIIQVYNKSQFWVSISIEFNNTINFYIKALTNQCIQNTFINAI